MKGRNRARGSTLIETLVAGAIITIATLGTMGFFIVASQNSTSSWRRSMAMRILATRQGAQSMLARAALEALPNSYQYDVRFDDNGTVCTGGFSACPSTTYRYTVCTRRESSAALAPSTSEVLTVRTRVDWASGTDGTGACLPDAALGGRYVTYVYEAAR